MRSDPRALSRQLQTWAEIDLDAIADNARILKEHIGPQTELMAVVKANAYGHGMQPVVRTALASGATWVGVNRVLEGVELRAVGVIAPILVLGRSLPTDALDIVLRSVIPSVDTVELAQALSLAAASAGVTELPVHIKVDTGMSRFGLMPDEVLPFARAVSKLPGLQLQGLWTHFASADDVDQAYTRRQLTVFNQVWQQLEDAGLHVPIRHTANSAAALMLPESRFELVRCGIALYGLPPASSVALPAGLRPAMTLKCVVGRVRTLPAGVGVSYGCTFVTSAPTRVALIAVGYGDGYPRSVSGRGAVLIHGQRAPILGRVCMDAFVVDVTHIPDVQANDEAVILGCQGDDEIDADELATWADTISYEVISALLPRVFRVYLRGGSPINSVTPVH